MTSDEARGFAAQWAEAWNRRDLERVLAHFHDEVEFTSPTALAVMGTPTLRGRKALREYWTRALAQIGSLRFTVDRVVWDPDSRELAIIYTSEIDGRVKRVSENLTFNVAGQVVRGDVFTERPLSAVSGGNEGRRSGRLPGDHAGAQSERSAAIA